MMSIHAHHRFHRPTVIRRLRYTQIAPTRPRRSPEAVRRYAIGRVDAKIGNGLDLTPLSRLELDLLLGKIETQIRAAQERGAACAEISTQISEGGYPIKCSTLRTALQRRRKVGTAEMRQGKRVGAQRDAATVVKNASTPPPPPAKE